MGLHLYIFDETKQQKKSVQDDGILWMTLYIKKCVHIYDFCFCFLFINWLVRIRFFSLQSTHHLGTIHLLHRKKEKIEQNQNRNRKLNEFLLLKYKFSSFLRQKCIFALAARNISVFKFHMCFYIWLLKYELK